MYHKFVPHFRDSGLSRYSEADTALKEEVREVLEEVVKEVLEDEEEMRKEAVDPFAEENLLQTPPAEGRYQTDALRKLIFHFLSH